MVDPPLKSNQKLKEGEKQSCVDLLISYEDFANFFLVMNVCETIFFFGKLQVRLLWSVYIQRGGGETSFGFTYVIKKNKKNDKTLCNNNIYNI